MSNGRSVHWETLWIVECGRPSSNENKIVFEFRHIMRQRSNGNEHAGQWKATQYDTTLKLMATSLRTLQVNLFVLIKH